MNFTMLNNTICWRNESGIDELLEQDLVCDDLGKMVFMYSLNKDNTKIKSFIRTRFLFKKDT